MLNATWRRLGSPAWLALGLVVLLPTMAQAQLFPNRTIRRERPPCSSEPPFNAQVRRDYFGYYPTCWSRFPAGWECPCPNPEKPNLDQSIRELGPLGGQKKPSLENGPRMDDNNPDDAGDRKPMDPAGDVPLPKPGRSPFDLDTKPQTPAPGADPFTSPNPPNPTPPAPGPGRNPNTSGALEMPKPPATTPSASYESNLTPGSLAMTPEATLTSGNATDTRPDLGTLPPPPVSMPNNLTSPSDPINQPTMAPPAQAQAPRRPGLLGRLFGSKTTQNR